MSKNDGQKIANAAMNAMIRTKALHGQNDLSGFSNLEMNEIIRGANPKDVIAARPERKMTTAEIITATAYMNEANVSWADAKAHIRLEAEQHKPNDMNTMIRKAAGREKENDHA